MDFGATRGGAELRICPRLAVAVRAKLWKILDGGDVLNKVTSLGGLFAQKSGHPLADARELRKVLAELPRDNAFKSLDEIAGWLESLAGVADFPADRLYDVLQQFEEAAAPHLKRLSQEDFHTARLSKSEEKRLWSIKYGFWTLLAEAYERCLMAVGDKAGSGELPKSTLQIGRA